MTDWSDFARGPCSVCRAPSTGARYSPLPLPACEAHSDSARDAVVAPEVAALDQERPS